jgi:hypothetical protein
MNVLGALAAVLLTVSAMGGCAAGTAETEAADEAPPDEPLGITVDAVDVAHGALRFAATMVDGAADVSVRLGGDCEHREVGGGLSTLSTLVWSLGDRDVAAAIGCGLVVRARVRDGSARIVNKVAEVDVAVDVSAEEGLNADDAPQLQSTGSSTEGVSVTFSSVARSARLTTGDSILERAAHDLDAGEASTDDTSGEFTIPRLDFARSVLRELPLHVDGAAFVTTLSVGGVALQREPSEPDEPEEAIEETTE